MTSSGTRSASSSASSVLPHAVGPVMQTHSTPAGSLMPLLAAQEQSIEILERDYSPRWAAVIAGFAALGSFHLAQQRVHLLYVQAPVARARPRGTPSSRAARCSELRCAACPARRRDRSRRRAPSARRRRHRAGAARRARQLCSGPRRTTSSPTEASSSPNCSTRSASRAETSKLTGTSNGCACRRCAASDALSRS